MTEFLSDEDLAELEPAESAAFRSPIPTQVISNGEMMPGPQTPQQKEVEARIGALAGELAAGRNMPRRSFLRTASGMAAAFVAMNEVYGPVFGVDSAEAAIPEKAEERATRLSKQFVFDDHTHFLRPDAGPGSALRRFVGLRKATAKKGWNPDMGSPEDQDWQDLQFGNYVKEMYFDSDTKLSMLSGAPSDIPGDWFLTNEMKKAARDKVNGLAGSKRQYFQAVFTPGQPGWIEDIARVGEELQPDSWKGYTIGDNTHKDTSKYPWRMDDEKVTYKGYEAMARTGVPKIVCVHKGLFPPSAAEKWPRLEEYASADDIGKAAKDWPDFKFMIYHAAYRHAAGGTPEDAWTEFEKTGRISWVHDLAEIPEKYGVDNVYADVGSTFANMVVTHPRLAAALMGTLIKGLGPDKVVWGTDSLWYGSPQWQIEALRRLEIPDDMQKKYGYAPLGPDDGLVKSAILGLNSARVYGLELKAAMNAIGTDRMAELKSRYEEAGPRRSLRAYGYVPKRA